MGVPPPFGPSDQEFRDWFHPRDVVGPARIRLEYIRQSFQATADVILDNTPPSANRTAALRDLLHASQSAVFALTHQPREQSDV